MNSWATVIHHHNLSHDVHKIQCTIQRQDNAGDDQRKAAAEMIEASILTNDMMSPLARYKVTEVPVHLYNRQIDIKHCSRV